MKKVINRILVLLMTAVFIAGTIGINIFSHFCSHCHVAHYSFDITPVDELACQCPVECECHCHSTECSDTSCDHSNIQDNCSMHSHDHEFLHIDDSYEAPEKLSFETFFAIEFVINYINSLKLDDSSSNNYASYSENPYVPDIISMNCTLLC